MKLNLFKPFSSTVTYGLFYYLGANVNLRQMFPKNHSYSCPCPSLELECTFPPGATFVLWSFGGTTITSPISGHVIDYSMMDHGMSSLHVNHSMYLKNNYRCHVTFSDGPQDSPVMTSPQPAGKLSHFCTCACTVIRGVV